MNQRKAKALRKLSGFKPNAEREYDQRVRSRDKDGNVVAVQVFCKGARATYNMLKKGTK